LLTGQCYFCSFSPEISEYIFCSKAWWNVLIHYFSILFLLAYFISRWQVIFAENKNFKEVVKTKMLKQDGKSLLVVFIFFLLWAVIGIGAAYLHIRQPNPNWLIELAVFIPVSLCMIFAVILLFNFVIFQHFLQGGCFFALNKTFWPIIDNIYKYMIWFLIYILLFSFLFQQAFSIVSWGGLFLEGRIFVTEFCVYFLIYTITALFIASLDYQEKIFFDDK
jgi:small-conductance mechanosensitive channel